MSGLLPFLRQSLLGVRHRIVGLLGFGFIFIAAAATARVLTAGESGHVELDPLFNVGGTTLVSALLLIGWLVGRFPLIAVLVLMTGIFSDDRAHGYTRLYAVRPRSLVLLYGARFLLFTLLAFALSAIVMPLFDIIMLGAWSGASILSLMAAQIIVFGSLTALLSLITRADAWVALFFGIVALIWDALQRAEIIVNAGPGIRQAVSVVLPPQGALLRIEMSFGASEPVPWDAFLYVCMYGALLLLVAGLALTRREI
jgi:hypothetical protein